MGVLGHSRRCFGLASALVLLVLVCPAFADTLEGRVVENHTGNPIVSAEARVTRIGQSGLATDMETDSEGRLRSPDLASGEYRVENSKLMDSNAMAEVLSEWAEINPHQECPAKWTSRKWAVT